MSWLEDALSEMDKRNGYHTESWRTREQSENMPVLQQLTEKAKAKPKSETYVPRSKRYRTQGARGTQLRDKGQQFFPGKREG